METTNMHFSPLCVLIFILGTLMGLCTEYCDCRPIAPNSKDRCTQDVHGQNSEVKACIRVSTRFLSRYLKGMKRDNFKVCRDFQVVRSCWDPLYRRCPQVVSSIPEAWRNLNSALDCACNGSKLQLYDHLASSTCHADIACFNKQYQGVLSRGCEDMYKFNIKQNTMDKCFFREQLVRCKESLVGSACGPEMGRLAFYVNQLTIKKPELCPLEPGRQTEAFRYSDRCPVNFVDLLEKCENDYLTHNRLTFNKNNHLVATKGRRRIRRACQNFHHYEFCISPVLDDCPEGVEMVYTLDSSLRLYTLKLNFICDDNKSDYPAHAHCYQMVLSNNSLAECSPILGDVTTLLKEVSAYEYYCEPYLEKSHRIQSVLDNLRACYENVFMACCGAPGANAMSGLLREAVRDPFYLRYVYRPDCELHGAPPITTTAAPSLRSQAVASKSERGSPGNNDGTKKSSTANAHSDSSSATMVHCHLALSLAVFLLLCSLGCFTVVCIC